MRELPPLPARMKSLPFSERLGIPVPYFVPIHDGIPNFKYADPDKLTDCYNRKLCSICGKRLEKREFWYVGGRFTLHNQVSTDGPMHKDCAEYAMIACPHMFYQSAERKTEAPAHAPQMAEKPTHLYLIKTNQLQRKRKEGNALFTFKATAAIRYDYKDNQLYLTGPVNLVEEREANATGIQEYIGQQINTSMIVNQLHQL